MILDPCCQRKKGSVEIMVFDALAGAEKLAFPCKKYKILSNCHATLLVA
jgi:hypothetical protein